MRRASGPPVSGRSESDGAAVLHEFGITPVREKVAGYSVLAQNADLLLRDTAMGPLQLILSGIGTLVVYGVLIAAVYKLFQIATDLSEIKEALQDIKRNTLDAYPPASWTSPPKQSSPESL